MYKSPESYSGNPEKTREEVRDTGKKVLSAAEVAAQQKEREDHVKQMMQDLAAKRAAEKATSSAPETLSPSAGEAAKKAKSNSAFKRALFGVLLGGGIALGAFAGYQANKQPAQTPTTAEATAEDTDTLDNPENQETASPFAGELANGVRYDYYEYADIENKTSRNAYGYDKSEAYGDREATENAWMDMANKGPEYLASYATHVFTDEEKQSLGIADMSCSQLDDYLSDAENIDGGEKQRNIMAALDAVSRDKENTFYEFYHEEGVENTYYISFVDLNNDGTYSPDELKLGYTTKKRNGAPQVDVYRLIKGEKVKVLDLNMECGMQPNDEQPPEDLPPIPSEDDDSAGNETSGTELSGSEPTPSGSEPTPTPEEPTPTPEEPTAGSESAGSESAGNETTDVKDPTAEIINAGEHVDQQPLDQNKTPVTTVEQDQANQQAIEQQRTQDAAAEAAAAQAAEQQKQQEAAAAAAAEQRRKEQAAAEQAAAAQAQAAAQAAAEQAAREQAAQAAAEQAAAAERAAREQAQREADAQAAANSANAASNADNTASERADDFANGNF